MNTVTINPNDVPTKTLRNGQEIPAIGMGTFGSDKFESDEIARAVAGAIRGGYRLFDCASVYGNEADIGNVFADAFHDGVAKREDLFVISKVWNDMHGDGNVLLSLAQTLKDLQFDYIDAFIVHWPFPNHHARKVSGDSRDPNATHFSAQRFMKTWRQMEALVDMGLAKSIGMSNMTIPKLDAVLPLCKIQPSIVEMELHPSFQQEELFRYCMQHDIQPIGFSPIGSPARPLRDTTPDDVVDIDMPKMVEIAKAHNVHPAIVALKWAVQRGQIPIPFSVDEAFYMSNLNSTITKPLSEKEMATIKGIDENCRLIKGHVFLWKGANDWRDLWDIDGIIAK